MEYLYTDGEFFHFMKTDGSFEQVGDVSSVGDAKQWLKEQETYKVTLWNRTISVVRRTSWSSRSRKRTPA